MNRLISIIIGFLTVAISASATNPTTLKAPAQHKATHKEAAAQNAALPEEMHLASVSRTNPFEIIAPESMHLDVPGDLSIEQLTADMLGFARKFIGTRYRLGGKGPKTGFDCSGFTGYVFSNFGISLAANSRSQYNQGQQVHRDEIQPGDLLFFKGRGQKGVGHVAIAVDNDPATGEVTFIHAATSKGVRIDKLSSAYYASRYVGARRVLSE